MRAWWLLFAAGAALLVAWLGLWRFSSEPIALRFLYYTNNTGHARIALMEITNHTDSPYEWKLRSEVKGVNHSVGITDLVETNGELRPVGPFDGTVLFPQDTLQFGTDDFEPGKRLWVAIKHVPKTPWEERRERMADWLWRFGLCRVAPYVKEGRRINGPVLPPNRP